MKCLMVLLVVMGTCFPWKYVLGIHEEYVAVITLVGPFQNADLLRLDVRAGSVTDVGEYRDVAIEWRN